MMRWLVLALIAVLVAPQAVAQRLPDPVFPHKAVTFVPEAQRAAVPYQTVKGRVIFRASVAGRDVWALLDNGADRTLIDMRLARSAGLKMASSNGKVFGAGGGHLVSTWVADVPVAIAGQFAGTMPMLGLDMSQAQQILGYRIEMVLGADALMHMALKVDPFARNFHLAPTGGIAAAAGARAIPMQGKRALIEVRIDGRPTTLAIDLGSNGGLSITHAAWRRTGSKGKSIGIGSARGATGDSYDVEVMMLDEISIGPHRVPGVSASLEPARPGTGDGIIGMAVLGKFVIVLDLGAGKLWLTPPEEPAEIGKNAP